MKIVITGGHLSPALEVINELQSNPKWSNTSILVLGRKYSFEGDKALSLEYLTMKKNKIPFEDIKTARLQRKFTRYTIFSLIKFPYGFFRAIFVMNKFKPDVVLSFGGYVSIPSTLAGFFLNIPVVIHEQTLEAGVANKIASIFAKKICISWEESRKFFPKSKTILTGIPVRKFKIQNLKFKIAEDKTPLIYVTGGSSGSHAINILIEGCLKKLLSDYQIIHQTGDSEYGDFDRLEKLKKSFPEKLQDRYLITKFVDPSRVGSILSKADLVISRSGINTVVELLSYGKPSLLIPLPYGQNNEQLKNALIIKKVGLGEIVNQEEVSSEDLNNKITDMFKNISSYKMHAKDGQTLIIENAAKKIVDVLSSEVH